MPIRFHRRLIMLVVTTVALAACGTPTVATTPTQSDAPTGASTLPTQAGATAAAATPMASAATTDDATQARLRVVDAVRKSPNMDVWVNGALAMNGDRALADIPALESSGFMYLAPGTYQLAVVPTGKGVAQAILGPLAVPVLAGHVYSVVMIGQITDKQLTPLVIDETAVVAQLGPHDPSAAVWIYVNNLAGPTGLDVLMDGKAVISNVAYGAFGAGIYPLKNYAYQVTVHGDPQRIIDEDDHDSSFPDEVWLIGAAGTYPGQKDKDFVALQPQTRSTLSSSDFLQGFSGKGIVANDAPLAFDTFLAAIKTAGLTDLMASKGPHLVFAPSDAAFAALPKDKRAALLAAPLALVRSSIVAGYSPWGNLSGKVWGVPDHTLTNIQGAQLVLKELGDQLTINDQQVQQNDTVMGANGSRVTMIDNVLLPGTK